jgi:hypothetical protein
MFGVAAQHPLALLLLLQQAGGHLSPHAGPALMNRTFEGALKTVGVVQLQDLWQGSARCKRCGSRSVGTVGSGSAV